MANSHSFSWGVMSILRGTLSQFNKELARLEKENVDGQIRIYNPHQRPTKVEEDSEVMASLGRDVYYVGPMNRGYEYALNLIVTKGLIQGPKDMKIELSRVKDARKFVVCTMLVHVVPSKNP